MPGSTFQYDRVPDAEEDSELLGLKPQPPTHTSLCCSTAHGHWLRRYWPLLFGGVFFSASLILFYASLHIPDAYCAERLSAYSPVLEAAEYHDVVFNGSLHHPSEFRGEPTSEVDAAWDNIASLRPLRLSEDELVKIGKEPKPWLAKFHEEQGGGYMAAIEIAHNMHCLNMLRKQTYWDHYAPLEEAYQRDPAFYRVHVDHCIEMLRQSLMCAGDVGLITFDWVAEHTMPWPDFTTQHRCRRFDKLVQWNQDHGIIVTKEHLMRTEGVVDLPEGP